MCVIIERHAQIDIFSVVSFLLSYTNNISAAFRISVQDASATPAGCDSYFGQ